MTPLPSLPRASGPRGVPVPLPNPRVPSVAPILNATGAFTMGRWLAQLPTTVIPSGALWITFAPEAIVIFNQNDPTSIPRVYPRPWPGIFGTSWWAAYERPGATAPFVYSSPGVRATTQFPLSEFPSSLPRSSPWVVAIRAGWRRDGSLKPLSIQVVGVQGLRLMLYSGSALLGMEGPGGSRHTGGGVRAAAAVDRSETAANHRGRGVGLLPPGVEAWEAPSGELAL